MCHQQNGDTAVHYAAKHGHGDIVSFFERNGVDVTAKNSVRLCSFYLLVIIYILVLKMFNHLTIISCDDWIYGKLFQNNKIYISF